MKINTRKHTYKKPLIICSIIVLVAAVLFSIYYFIKLNENQRRHEESLTSIDANKNKTESDKSIDGTVDPSRDKTVVPADPSSESDLEKPTITRASQSSDNIRVSAIFTKPAFGTCTAVFEKPGYTSISKSVPIVVGPSYYTCNGFLVPVSEFSIGGSWQVKVIYKQNDKTITSDAQTIIIE